ncbi:hypothetical protein UFOVP207_58 [uncultured Caudovirales phage]|uniref:Uncharacterized protein n=1 Tax=uncultured Caudovirales phage TaxID=2100421 RepID=A0A6J7WMM1_9CAUD|nr:hypothetical protein UFOVP207_58 [uncultured Caudovirales phage]
MAEKKVIELEVKTNTASLKAQLREAQQEVQTLSDKFGATSQEAINAAKKAAQLKDAIGDAKALTDAFNPDAKFNALSASIGGVLNGFQAFEGALGLVGVEGEAVQQTLLKVQSAMALSQGLQGLAEAKDSFKQLGAVISQTAIGQKLLTAAQIVGAATMRVLNAVMAANPILLVVGAVGALVGALEILKSSQDGAAAKQRELNRQLEYTKRLEQESINTTSERVNELKKQHENKLRLKQAEGVADSELAKIEIENKKEILRYYNLVYQGGAKLNKDQLADAKQLRLDIKILEAQKITDLRESNKSKKIITKEDKEEELQLRKDNLENYKSYSDLELQISTDNVNKQIELDDLQLKHKEENAAIEKQILDGKIQAVSNTFQIIGNLATLFAGKSEKEQRKAFEIQKAANIGQTLIDTYKSATSSYASLSGIPVVGPALGFVAAGAAVTAGLANVKNIANQQYGGGASGQQPNTPSGLNSGSVITPRFNIIGNNNQSQIAQLNQAPIKAYVVGSDVTTQQMLDKKKVQNATL